MRKSTLFLFAVSAELVVLGLLLVHAFLSTQAQHATLRQNTEIVRRLGLTDLALFPEARYTRHLSQADWHSAFQDHPLSLEHFPSGSFTLPPTGVWSDHADVD